MWSWWVISTRYNHLLRMSIARTSWSVISVIVIVITITHPLWPLITFNASRPFHSWWKVSKHGRGSRIEGLRMSRVVPVTTVTVIVFCDCRPSCCHPVVSFCYDWWSPKSVISCSILLSPRLLRGRTSFITVGKYRAVGTYEITNFAK